MSREQATRRGVLSAVVRHLVPRISLRSQARLVAAIVPARLRFRAALLLSRLHGRLDALRGGNRAFTQALMLDLWLRELTFSGPYSIPIRVVGGGLLKQPSPRGILFCWTHLPLIEQTLRPVMAAGFQPFVVADSGKTLPGGQFLVPGLAQHAGAISSDAAGLLQARTILRSGGAVSTLLDPFIGGKISPQILRLADKLGARILLNWAELTPDGEVQVTFIEPPHPAPGDDATVDAILEYVRLRNHQILEAFGVVPESSTSAETLMQSPPPS